jgi:hypothetical protein
MKPTIHTPSTPRHLALPIGQAMADALNTAATAWAPNRARQRRVMALPCGVHMCACINEAMACWTPPTRPARRSSGEA